MDGLNLYHGALKDTPFKWLDLVEPARCVLPQQALVDRVLYFTARVSGKANSGAPGRQHVYISALRTLPEIEVHFGSFLAKTVWRPLNNLPVAGRQIQTPSLVTLPAGHHKVIGPPDQTLPVDTYPIGTARKKRRRKSPAPVADALIASRRCRR